MERKGLTVWAAMATSASRMLESGISIQQAAKEAAVTVAVLQQYLSDTEPHETLEPG